MTLEQAEVQNAYILADSINSVTGDRFTTFVLPRFPYALIQEPATHRILSAAGDINPFGHDLSRNSASLRAVPTKRIIQRCWDDPYIPTWTRNQKGMSGADTLDEATKAKALTEWEHALEEAITTCEHLSELGVAKQEANRILAPFLRIPIIVSGTEWENFFSLRTADGVQPDFRQTAIAMERLYRESKPVTLNPGDWHIPYGDRFKELGLRDRLKNSVACCARISYLNHDGEFSFSLNCGLHDDLLSDCHMSPFEHQAIATGGQVENFAHHYWTWHNNSPTVTHTRTLKGFYSYRSHIEDGREVSA